MPRAPDFTLGTVGPGLLRRHQGRGRKRLADDGLRLTFGGKALKGCGLRNVLGNFRQQVVNVEHNPVPDVALDPITHDTRGHEVQLIDLLTDNQPPYDPAMGTYQLRALLCRVSKADSAP